MSLRWKILALAAAVALVLTAVVLLPKPGEVEAVSAVQNPGEAGAAASAGSGGGAGEAATSTAKAPSAPAVPARTPSADRAAGGVGSGSAAPAGVAGGAEAHGPAGETYVVKSGDTPASIARQYLGEASRWTEIVRVNPGLDARSLQIGQVLRLPAGATPGATDIQTARTAKGPVSAPGASRGAGATGAPLAMHRVAQGDSLYNLARRYYGDASRWELIRDANPAMLGAGVQGLRLDSELVIPAPPAREP